jgi:hypothetical protein
MSDAQLPKPLPSTFTTPSDTPNDVLEEVPGAVEVAAKERAAELLPRVNAMLAQALRREGEWCAVEAQVLRHERERRAAEAEQREPSKLPIPPQGGTADRQAAADTAAHVLTAEERCIAIFLRDPNKSNRQIAKEAGCSPSILSRPKLKALRQMHAGQLRKGEKTKAGDVEAEDESG